MSPDTLAGFDSCLALVVGVISLVVTLALISAVFDMRRSLRRIVALLELNAPQKLPAVRTNLTPAQLAIAVILLLAALGVVFWFVSR